MSQILAKHLRTQWILCIQAIFIRIETPAGNTFTGGLLKG